jgi:hypothetical protein
MDDRYFACPKCQVFVNAGYRWCYWELEHPAIVYLGEQVDVDRVFTHKSYWNPPENEDSTWLHNEILPAVREFLSRHATHGVMFWEDRHLPDDVFLSWLQVGYHPSPSPRYLAEVLGLTTWDEVLAWKARQEHGLWALGDDKEQQNFRQAFEQYAQSRAVAREHSRSESKWIPRKEGAPRSGDRP